MSFNPKDFYEKGSNKIIRTGLQLFLDAGNTSSYIGSGTTWTDISGNSRNGTLTNGPTFSSGNGGSIVFDGTNDYIGGTGLDNASTSLNGASAITLSLWLKRATVSTLTPQNFIGFFNAFATHKFFVSFTTTNLIEANFRSANEVLQQTRTTTTAFASTAVWYHVSIVVNFATNSILIYVNGALQSATGTVSFSQTTLANGTTAGNNRVGSLGNVFTNIFNGNIAQVLIYNRGLSATEVLLNFNYQKNKYGL
jgi:hypothetical protein